MCVNFLLDIFYLSRFVVIFFVKKNCGAYLHLRKNMDGYYWRYYRNFLNGNLWLCVGTWKGIIIPGNIYYEVERITKVVLTVWVTKKFCWIQSNDLKIMTFHLNNIILEIGRSLHLPLSACKSCVSILSICHDRLREDWNHLQATLTHSFHPSTLRNQRDCSILIAK